MTNGVNTTAKVERPSAGTAWLVAARPRTLTIAAIPVLVGAALSVSAGAALNVGVFLVTLLASMLIQLGTNLDNDVGDYERGSDGPGRLGPPRATSQGWLTPNQVRAAVTLVFGLSCALGAYLAWYGGWPILLIGILSVIAGVAYTSGPKPIAYTGLGEAFVIVFFGIVAVVGTYYLQAFSISAAALTLGLIVGLHPAAVLVVNNYRDADTDRRNGKHTLAVRMGRSFTRWEYTAFVVLPFLLLPLAAAQTGRWLVTALPLAAVPLAVSLLRRFWREPIGPGLNPLLGQTAMLQVVFCLLVAAGLVL